MNRLKEKYDKKVVPELKKEFGIKNALAVPKIKKVVLNTGIGRFLKDGGLVDSIVNDMSKISGQAPLRTKAKKSIASFKIREGMDVGVKVTLRGPKMYDFLDRLISISLPRTRDFRGLDPKAIDTYGNFTIGIKEQIVFPEINQESSRGIFGLQVNVITDCQDKEKATRLFKLLGFPIKD